MSPEQPPRGEHQSDGPFEEAGKTVRDTMRVCKIHLEEKIGKELAVHLPIDQWMPRWAAMALSRFNVGKDRRTAYERQRGKRCQIRRLQCCMLSDKDRC